MIGEARNKMKVTITNDSLEKFEAEVIMVFEVKEFGKKYVVYRFADEVEEKLSTIHTSILKEETKDHLVLEEITNDDEWSVIKEIMKDIVNSERVG